MIAQAAADTVDPVVALIVTIPSTIAALGAWFHSRHARREAAQANQAVNCRPPGAPSISEQVDRIAQSTQRLEGRVSTIAEDVRDQRHEIARLAVELGTHGRKLDELAGQ